MGRPLRIFTMAWGKQHLDWFERACLRSLSWPKNREALKDASWLICSKKEDKDEALGLAMKTKITEKFEYFEMNDAIVGNSPNMGRFMLHALQAAMDLCLKDGARMLTAPPDTIFSDGTIPALLLYGAYGDTCVAVPHARVSPSIFGSLKEGPLSGAELVSRAIKHGHKAWTTQELGAEPSGSFVGGVLWQKIAPNLYSVQHRLPTVYLSSFTSKDVMFFRQPHGGYEPVYGLWDHVWPALLVQDERQRTPGSSDVACIVEVTKEELNIPPPTVPNAAEPDAFWQREFHHRMNRQFSYIMRSE